MIRRSSSVEPDLGVRVGGGGGEATQARAREEVRPRANTFVRSFLRSARRRRFFLPTTTISTCRLSSHSHSHPHVSRPFTGSPCWLVPPRPNLLHCQPRARLRSRTSTHSPTACLRICSFRTHSAMRCCACFPLHSRALPRAFIFHTD